MQAAKEDRIAYVLCVGEDEVKLQLRRFILERSGYRVSTARSSALALEIFRIGHLDLVVSDYALDGGTSLAMLRIMRQKRPDLAVLLVLSNVDTPKEVPSGVHLVRVTDGPAALLAEAEEVLSSRRLSLMPPLILASRTLAEHPTITPVSRHRADLIRGFPLLAAVGATLASAALATGLVLAVWPGKNASFPITPAQAVSTGAVAPVARRAFAVASNAASQPMYSSRRGLSVSVAVNTTVAAPRLPTKRGPRIPAAEAPPILLASRPVRQLILPTMAASVRLGTPMVKPSNAEFVPDRSLRAHADWVTSVKFSADGERLVSASWDQSAKLWDISTGEQVKTIAQHIKGIQAVAFSRDGRLLAEEDASDAVKVWNTSAVSAPREFREHGAASDLLHGRSWVYSIAFSPDGRWLATGVGGKTVRIWDLETGRPMRDLTAADRAVLYAAFSSDGRWLVSGADDKTIRIWDVESGTMVRSFTGHTDLVCAAVFSPDGHTLASASKDRSVKLWDVDSGRLLYTLHGHHGSVTSIAFSPHGERLLSGSWDTTLKLWDVSSGRELQTLKGNTHPVYSVAFASNGKWIASGSEDGSIRVWRSAQRE